MTEIRLQELKIDEKFIPHNEMVNIFQVDLRGSELEGIRDRLKASAHHRLAEDIRELQEQFDAINREVKVSLTPLLKFNPQFVRT